VKGDFEDVLKSVAIGLTEFDKTILCVQPTALGETCDIRG
jgi:hypothetical protein